MFKIKICGITRAEDATVAIEAGADAVGFNFYPRSRRFVSVDVARALRVLVPVAVRKVGVFVNSSAQEVSAIAGEVGVECVQLHGDEPPEMLAQLPAQVFIVSVFRCAASGLAPLDEYLEKCHRHGRVPDAVLIDAASEATVEYGGTGRLADWDVIARQRELLRDTPLIIAGGLTPENVADAICVVRPHGVDVASGVESSPGKKDAAKVRDFVAAALAALPAAAR